MERLATMIGSDAASSEYRHFSSRCGRTCTGSRLCSSREARHRHVSEYPELDEIMNGIRSRSETAFATAYRYTADPLASFANGMVRDRQFAEDAVQQAFLELVQAAATINGDGRSLRAWLFRSVRFTCLDEVRRKSRRPEHLTDVVPEVGVEPELPSGHPQGSTPIRNLPPRWHN